MRRREFLRMLGGAVSAWPAVAHAQKPERLRLIGMLTTGNDPEMKAFEQELEKRGWSEGRNIHIEYRYALIPKANMMALVDRHPQVAKAALKLLSSRQRTLGTVVEDLALRDVTTRVARLLLGCMGQRAHIVEKAPDACAHITHQEIASMVGSVREVVQRALKELERDGAIVLERTRICLRDQAKLEQWAHLSG